MGSSPTRRRTADRHDTMERRCVHGVFKKSKSAGAHAPVLSCPLVPSRRRAGIEVVSTSSTAVCRSVVRVWGQAPRTIAQGYTGLLNDFTHSVIHCIVCHAMHNSIPFFLISYAIAIPSSSDKRKMDARYETRYPASSSVLLAMKMVSVPDPVRSLHRRRDKRRHGHFESWNDWRRKGEIGVIRIGVMKAEGRVLFLCPWRGYWHHWALC